MRRTLPRAHDLDPVEAGAVEGEGALDGDADAAADLADGEVRGHALSPLADDDAGEDLDAVLVAIEDLGVDAHGVAVR